jgi:hypothetical protein
MTPRIRFFTTLAASAFGTMIVLSAIGSVLEARGVLADSEAIGPIAATVFFALFLLLAFSLVPLVIHAFLAAQTRIGNGDGAAIRVLRANERRLTYGVWVFFALGFAIAVPAMLIGIGDR